MPAPPKDDVALRAKLEWAERDIYELDDWWRSFAIPYNYPVVSKYDRKTKQYTFKLVNLAPIPIGMSLLVGDIVHNLRCALDHAAYRIVCVGTGSQGPFVDRVYFPIGETRKKFESKLRTIKKLLRGRSSKAVAFLENIQAYNGGLNAILWQLSELDIIDKHRLLLPVVAQNRMHSMPPSRISELRMRFLGMKDIPERHDNQLFLTASQTPSIDLKPGHILGTFIKAEMHKKMHFPFDIAFREPEIVKAKPVRDVLWQMHGATQDVIMAADRGGFFG